MGLSLLREVVYEGLAEHVDSLRKSGSNKYSKQQYDSLQKSLTSLRKDNAHVSVVHDKVSVVFILFLEKSSWLQLQDS